MQSMPTLEEWAVAIYSQNAYAAPEDGVPCLSGRVFGHPKIEEGHRVLTSDLIALNVVRHLALTKSRFYSLGKPSEDWLDWLVTNGHALEDFNFKEELLPAREKEGVATNAEDPE